MKALWIGAVSICSLFVFTGEAQTMNSKSVYDFTVKNIDGQDQTLSDYKGKLLLVVNVASKCGFTKQYDGLQKVYEKYKDQGLVVLGFPANNFMGQEPGTNSDIKSFCTLKFNVSFPMYSKISVKGKDIDPLYQYLTKESGFDGDISWNFNKFLVGTDGRVIARYGSNVDPLSGELTEKIEASLPKS